MKKYLLENKFYLFIGFAILFSIYSISSMLIYGNTYTNTSNTLITILPDIIMGNLGKTTAMLGFLGTALVYSMVRKSSVLFFGITLSLIAGGLVGISSVFFCAGQASFIMSK